MLLPCCSGRSINVRRAAVAASMALCVYLVLAIILLPALLVPRYRWVMPAAGGRCSLWSLSGSTPPSCLAIIVAGH